MHRKVLLWFLACLFLGISCNELSPEPDNEKSVNKVIIPKLAGDTTIYSRSGIPFIIYEGSFADKNGNVVNSGIELTIQEYFTYHDMILSDLSTTSNGRILETSGMFNIKASCNNEELYLVDSIGISIITDSLTLLDSTRVFFGERNDTSINWIEDSTQYVIFCTRNHNVDTFKIDTFLVYPDLNSNKIIKLTKLGWVNFDRYIDYNNLLAEFLITPNLEPAQKANTYMVFKNRKSILKSYQKGEQIYFCNLPKGEETVLISYFKEGDDFLFSKRNITISDNIQNPVLDYKSITEEEFIKELEAL